MTLEEQPTAETATEQQLYLVDVSEEGTQRLLEIFKALSDEHRLKIALRLMQGEVGSVKELQELLGQSQPATSHHLKAMKQLGVVTSRRDGKNNIYSINRGEFKRAIAFIAATAGDIKGVAFTEDSELAAQRAAELAPATSNNGTSPVAPEPVAEPTTTNEPEPTEAAAEELSDLDRIYQTIRDGLADEAHKEAWDRQWESNLRAASERRLETMSFEEARDMLANAIQSQWQVTVSF